MNAINLLLPDHHPSKVWACGKCKFIRHDQADAEACCTPLLCRGCGQPTGTFRNAAHPLDGLCGGCQSAEYARRDAERLVRATKLESWDGWVCWDSHGPNDGYFPGIIDLVDYLVDQINLDDWPEFVHVCKSRRSMLDVGRILEDFCDEGYEDMCDALHGTEEFVAAIAAFNEANRNVLTYNIDYSRAVRVPRPEDVLDAAELAERRAAEKAEANQEVRP